MNSRLQVCLTLALATVSASLAAQPLPKPEDTPYPGVIELNVDATDLAHHVFWVHESIPVKPGNQVLLFPEWIPGTHSKSYSAVQRLAGLHLSSAGKPIEWKRDTVEMAAFHIDVPPGVTQIEADFQFLSPSAGHNGGQRVVMSQEIMTLGWGNVVLYPAGYAAKGIVVAPSLTIPAGCAFGTALEPAAQSANVTRFKPVSLEELVDSPVLAGKYFKRVDLDTSGAAHVWLDIVADRPTDLEAKPEQIAAHRALVQQAYRLYGSHHYDHYDFLLSLSEQIGGEGLEHHQSSENGVRRNYFTEWDDTWGQRDLLAHEFTHSWNGKFRRPADLYTPNYNVPMQDSLLWMYEGQTEYWGKVLAVRSGLVSAEQMRDIFAENAAAFEVRSGRTWRNLQDTTNEEILGNHEAGSWPSWQRGADYYVESQLFWLDVDTRIREMSHGSRSLDDFARAFFGVNDGSRVVLTYRFEDIVAALNAIEPYDWAGYLRERLDTHAAQAPLDGIARGGWELVYTDVPSLATKQIESELEGADFYYSLGLYVGKEGKLDEVRWDSPAFRAGIAPQMQLVAINGHAYDSHQLRDAVVAAKASTEPIQLIVRDGDAYRVLVLDYHDGLRYPHLVRKGGTSDSLSAIFAARP